MLAGSVIACFWWFKSVAIGIEGPISEHKGLGWRKVRKLIGCLLYHTNAASLFSQISTVMERKPTYIGMKPDEES